MTARIIPFPGRDGVLVTHPSISRFIDPALIRPDVLGSEFAALLEYHPQPQNVVQIKAGVYQPGRE